MEGSEANKDVMTSSITSGSDTTATSSDNESWTILDEDEALEDDITVSFKNIQKGTLPSWSRLNPNGAVGEDFGAVLKPKLDPKLDAY